MHFETDTTQDLAAMMAAKNIHAKSKADLAKSLPASAAVLAFDYGQKKIGVATGVWPEGFCSPHVVVYYKTRLERFMDMKTLQDEQSAKFFIIGLPLHADGLAHLTTLQAIHFGLDVLRYFNKPVIWVDERFTTRVITAAIDGEDRDAQSAEMIAQAFFDSHDGRIFYAAFPEVL